MKFSPKRPKSIRYILTGYILFFLLFVQATPASTDPVDFPPPLPHNGEPVESQWQNIVEVCVPYGLDPYLVAAIVKIESWFEPQAYNIAERDAYEAGYRDWYGEYYGKGLMQVTGPWVGGVPYPSEVEWQYNMPPTSRPGEAPRMDNAYDARQNLGRGCWYLSKLAQHYDTDIRKMLTAYSRGWQRVDDGSIDPNTFEYTRQVEGYFAQYLQDVGKVPGERMGEDADASLILDRKSEVDSNKKNSQTASAEERLDLALFLKDYEQSSADNPRLEKLERISPRWKHWEESLKPDGLVEFSPSPPERTFVSTSPFFETDAVILPPAPDDGSTGSTLTLMVLGMSAFTLILCLIILIW